MRTLSEKSPPAPRAYAEMLLRVAAEKDLDPLALARLSGYEVSRRGQGAELRFSRLDISIAMALQARRALIDAGCVVPALVLDGDDEQVRWARAGAEIQARAKDEFGAMLRDAEEYAASLVPAPAPRLLAHHLRSDAEPEATPERRNSDDRPQRYRGQRGPANKGVVDTDRKQAPRSRR